MSFFGNLNNHLRVHLRRIEIRAYVKKDARNALTFLAEANCLEHLRLEVDVVKDDDPVRAAGLFWPDVCKLLEAVGSRIEKSMVLPRKVKPQKPEVESEKSSQDEQSESASEDEDEGEGEDEDAGEDSDTEKTAKSAKSESAEIKDDKEDVVMSTEPKDAEDITKDIKTDLPESDDRKPAEVNAEDTKAQETHASAAAETTSEKTSDASKQDSKSPVPAAPTKKERAQPEPIKLIQGKKCFAVDILYFGTKALKNKDGELWDHAQKQKFLTTLEGKLK
jgi:outer membrane biosynthesis protein TonB